MVKRYFIEVQVVLLICQRIYRHSSILMDNQAKRDSWNITTKLEMMKQEEWDLKNQSRWILAHQRRLKGKGYGRILGENMLGFGVWWNVWLSILRSFCAWVKSKLCMSCIVFVYELYYTEASLCIIEFVVSFLFFFALVSVAVIMSV